MKRTAHHLTDFGRRSGVTRLLRATAAGARNALQSMPRSRAFFLLESVLGRWIDRARVSSVTDALHCTRVLSVDIDRLKAINDGFGHQAGDRPLVMVSRPLSKYSGATHVVARFGGDEFAVLLPVTSSAEAASLLQRILGEVRPLRDGSVAQLAAANASLYRAKAAGGERVTTAQTKPALSDKRGLPLRETLLAGNRTPLGEHG